VAKWDTDNGTERIGPAVEVEGGAIRRVPPLRRIFAFNNRQFPAAYHAR
jgi:hypothetical protein